MVLAEDLNALFDRMVDVKESRSVKDKPLIIN